MSNDRWLAMSNGMYTLVDFDVREAFSGSAIGVARRGRSVYATSQRKYLHRLIMMPGPGLEVDHVNGDGLDNRRSNLRVCSRSGNMRNKRRSVGRDLPKCVRATKGGKFSSYINAGGRQVYLGTFLTADDASVAYHSAAKMLFGDFARKDS